MTANPYDTSAAQSPFGTQDNSGWMQLLNSALTPAPTAKPAPAHKEQAPKAAPAPAHAAPQAAQAAPPDQIDERQLMLDASERETNALNTMGGLLKADQDKQQEIQDKYVQPFIDKFDALDEAHEKAKQAYDQHQELMRGALQEMDTQAKAIAAESPGHLWAEQGLGVKIATIALMGLGAAAQSFYGDKTNAAVDSMDAMIKRDLAVQKMRMEQNQQSYANKNLLLGRMSEYFDRTEHAEDAAYATAVQGVLGRLQVIKGLVTDPQMKDNLTKFIAQATMKAAPDLNRLQVNIAGKSAQLQQGVEKIGLEKQRVQQGAINTAAHVQSVQQAGEKLQLTKNSLEIPGWAPPQGQTVKGSPQEIAKLRDSESGTRQVTRALQQMDSDIQKGVVANLDPRNIQKLLQDFAEVTEEAKKDGLVGTGANFTQNEQALITNAYGNKMSSIAMRQSAHQRIQAKLQHLWFDIQTKMKERNLVMQPNHDFYAGEK